MQSALTPILCCRQVELPVGHRSGRSIARRRGAVHEVRRLVWARAGRVDTPCVQPRFAGADEPPRAVLGPIVSFWIGNVFLVILNIPLIGMWVRLLSIPHPLFPGHRAVHLHRHLKRHQRRVRGRDAAGSWPVRLPDAAGPLRGGADPAGSRARAAARRKPAARTAAVARRLRRVHRAADHGHRAGRLHADAGGLDLGAFAAPAAGRWATGPDGSRCPTARLYVRTTEHVDTPVCITVVSHNAATFVGKEHPITGRSNSKEMSCATYLLKTRSAASCC